MASQATIPCGAVGYCLSPTAPLVKKLGRLTAFRHHLLINQGFIFYGCSVNGADTTRLSGRPSGWAGWLRKAADHRPSLAYYSYTQQDP